MDEDQVDLDRLSRAVRERLRRQPVGARIDAQAILQDLSASFPAVPMDEIWSVIKRQCKALGLNYRQLVPGAVTGMFADIRGTHWWPSTVGAIGRDYRIPQ